MLFTSVAVPKPYEAEAATKKVTITNVSKGTLTIKRGSTYQLKAKTNSKSKVTFVWKSSNSKKVSVNKSGKIKGLQTGTATITVGVKGKNYKKASVKVNLYVPNSMNDERLPVVFNIHGGGFVGGDADVLDTQSERIANEWNVVVVTINYTKADVKPVSFGSEEIRDGMMVQ